MRAFRPIAYTLTPARVPFCCPSISRSASKPAATNPRPSKNSRRPPHAGRAVQGHFPPTLDPRIARRADGEQPSRVECARPSESRLRVSAESRNTLLRRRNRQREIARLSRRLVRGTAAA